MEECISLAENAIKIKHTMQRLQNEDLNDLQKTRIIVTEPKSYTALRTIPIPEFVTDVIKPFVGAPNTYVLSGECKAIIEPRTMQNRFKTYLIEGQINDANSHSLRHTFATRCVEAGFDVKTLSEILGHSSVKM
jgi:integrase